MNEAQRAAEDALDRFKQIVVASGTDKAIRALVRDVWAQDLDRYEPDELGDTPKALGLQCAENLRELAVRRQTGDEREAPENHWNIPDLRVSTPRSVLTLTMDGRRIVPMKVPMSHGRTPRFDLFRDWEHGSDVRNEMAKRNSAVLGGFTTAHLGQPMLLSESYDMFVIQDFMLLWAGDPESALTAGYLAVPAKGPTPFAATIALWWDEIEETPRGTARRAPDGPSFDEKGAGAPSITLKPRPAIEEQA
ncbi:MAG: hypothetical protein ACR2H3_04215 [Acidimicrobiales bacterium]